MAMAASGPTPVLRAREAPAQSRPARELPRHARRLPDRRRQPAAGRTIKHWGKRRWRIEAFFKTTKSRFGLDRFGQCPPRGASRFLVLSLVAFVLAFWTALGSGGERLEWGAVARLDRDELVPEAVALEAKRTLERLKPILEALGIVC